MMHSTTIRYAPLPPLRPKRSAEQGVIAVPRTPAPLCTDIGGSASAEPTLSATTTASDLSNTNLSPSSTDRQLAGSASSATSATKLDEKMVINPLQSGNVWPSQIAGRMTTSWLLPAHNDQSSAIVLLLKTEIESHKVSKEMLHATEQKRLEAVHYCRYLEATKQKLETDVCNWAAAYNALAVAFSQCSAEHKRLAGGNAIQGNNVDIHAPFQAHGTPPTDAEL
ncbi:hypothetical protein BU23DRAFT_556172 [Bimuria novae-zelandiae CBS 107.79]|uniref:Uncharacterized protein n=1 Tax=Bimuria novae-zelandiae CBS 107.79 TaxID=1447943 RepID=A0A6A5V531_9PLEO|nr:hypothetical protein BU23DRAFT_556172 [Bimuria novae-zelandiae CBS 107.79]